MNSGSKGSDPADPTADVSLTGNDESLAADAARGSEQAYERLVERYKDRIFNLFVQLCGSRTEAEDLSQETFLKAFRALKNFRKDSKFYTWLFRIAVNTGISRGRQISRLREREGVSLHSSPGGSGQQEQDSSRAMAQTAAAPEKFDPESVAGRKSIQERVRHGLQELSQEYRAVVVLRDMEGLDYESIAQSLSISKAAVKSRLHRARSQLAKILKDLRPEGQQDDS